MSKTIGFLLLEDFSLYSYANCVEALRTANEIAGNELYRFVRLAAQTVVHSEDSVAITVEQTLHLPHQCDGLVICGNTAGFNHETLPAEQVLPVWIKTALQQLDWCGAIASGVDLLAQAGLLSNKKISTCASIEMDSAVKSQQIRLSEDLFSVDGKFWTCRGGSASLDMMLFLLSRQHSVDLSEMVARTINRKRLGAPRRPKLLYSDAALKTDVPVLFDAIELMRANMEEPLTTDDIASHLELSRRHLERLFKKHLDALPSRFYQQLRLEFARKLLLSESTSITEIALRSGFSSGGHFSTAYRNVYGVTPKEERTINNQTVS